MQSKSQRWVGLLAAAVIAAGLGVAQVPSASAAVTGIAIANTPQVVDVDGTTPMLTTTVTPTGVPVQNQYRGQVSNWATAGLTNPSGILRDDSLYYVLNDRMGTPSIKVLDDTGSVLRTLSLPGSITGKLGASLQMDDSGTLYVAELRDASGTWTYDDTIHQLLGARGASGNITLTAGATIIASPTADYCTVASTEGFPGVQFFTVKPNGTIYAFSKAISLNTGSCGGPAQMAGTVWQVDVGGATSGTLTGTQVMDNASGDWNNDTNYWNLTATNSAYPYAATTRDDTLWVAGGSGIIWAVPLDPVTGAPGIATPMTNFVTSPGLVGTVNTGQLPVGGIDLDSAGERLYFTYGNSVRTVLTSALPGVDSTGLAGPRPTQADQFSGNAVGAPWVARFNTWGAGGLVVNGDATAPAYGNVRVADYANAAVKEVAVTGYSLTPVNSDDITPALVTDDTGLTFNTNGSISGTVSTTVIPTLTGANNPRNYTVAYTNLDGSSATGPVQLTFAVAPSSFVYRTATSSGMFGNQWAYVGSASFALGAATPLQCPSTQTNTGLQYAMGSQTCSDSGLFDANSLGLGVPQANQFTIVPALPLGMSLNATTGAISGTPLAVTPMTTYAITAANPGGDDSTTIQFATSAAAPGGTVAVPGNASALVSVTPVTGPFQPTSYTVTASPGGGTCTITPPAATCQVTGLTNGTAYTFTSVANYTGSISSAPTSASSAVTPSATPLAPGDPDAPLVVSGNASAAVTVVPASGGPPAGAPTSYTVTASPGGATCSVTVPATGCTLTGLTNGTTYNVSTTATNGAGTSSASGSTSVTPGVPGVPSPPVALVSGTGAAQVSVATPAGATPSSYTVTATPGGATCTITPPASSCNITGLANGTVYTFAATATGAGGTSASSSASPAVTASATLPAPGIPGFPVATAGPSQASVAVTPPSTGGAPASYLVTASPGGATCSVTAPALACTVSGLTNGTAYSFTSTATNSAGTSAASPASAAVTPSGSGPNPGPTPPTPVTPSAPGSVSVVAGSGSATVSWSAPANPGSFAVTQYRVIASPGGASCLVPASSTTCTLSPLTNGTTYTVSVSALSGAGWGAAATSAPFTPGASVPAIPSITSVLAGNGAVTVSVAAGSGGGSVTSYLVTSAPGGATCTVTAPASSCVMTGLTNGTAYTFTATATGPGGTSGASAASTAVTPVAPITPTPAPLPGPLAPGQSNLQQGGQTVPVTVTPNGQSNGLVVNATGFTMTLQGENGQGRPLPLSDGVLVLEQDRTLRTSGTGFFPNTDVDLYLDPPAIGDGSMLRANAGSTYLGSVSTDTLGDFDGTVQIDPSVGVGDHVVQAIGVTQDNLERAMSLGVRVEEAVATRPGPVRDLTVVSKTKSTVKVSWKTPLDDGGSPITKYKVRHRLKGDERYQGKLQVTGLTATVKGLTPGKIYYIRVKAVNAIGTGPSGGFVKVRLPRG